MNTRLRTLRIESGLTQKQLAIELNTTDKNIWAYEKGSVTPPPTTLLAYAKHFNVTMDYLFGLENDFGVRTAAHGSNTYTRDERKFVEDIRKLSPGLRDILRSTLDAMLGDTEEEKYGKSRK